ncbi:MAG: FkbM family methyltransferase [Bacteroidales bacterium]|nr:FkbM family methyltransferase [Bacteroidales bacterium]
MRYIIRRLLNKITRGRWIRMRALLSSRMQDDIEYYLGTDIGNKLYLEGEFEKNELSLCANYINEYSNIVDIGANIGIHSIYFSSLAKKGKVLCIEPQLTIYPTLLKNIMSFENIIPLNVAIDSKISITEFFIADDNAYSSLKDTKRKNIILKKHVVTLPFDSLSGLFQKIDFIKIDVEGFEHNVLLSMENILKKDKPVLFIEIYGGTNSNVNPEDTIKFLINLGYQAYFVNVNGDLERFINHSDSFYNYFFIYEDTK